MINSISLNTIATPIYGQAQNSVVENTSGGWHHRGTPRGIGLNAIAKAIQDVNVANTKDVSEVKNSAKTPEERADEVLFKDFIRHRKSPELKDIEQDLKYAKNPVFDPRNFAGGEYHKSIDVTPDKNKPEYTITTQIDIVYEKDKSGKEIAKITITHERKKDGITYKTEGGHESICELRKKQ